jgi:hypothetical protein
MNWRRKGRGTIRGNSAVGRFTPTTNTATYPLSADEWSAIKGDRSEVFWTITPAEYFEGKEMQPSFQSGWYWSNDIGRIAIP